MNSFITIQVRILAQQAMRQVQQMQSQLNGMGSTFSNAQVAGRNFANGIATASTRVEKFGSQMQWTGRQIEYNFTLPIAAAGAAAMKFALDNEAATVRIQKVYGDTSMSAVVMRNEINALSKSFEALSNQYGVQRQQVIGIAADWAAAGASGIALAKATELTMQTMILGEMDAKAATQALIAIQAQYGQSTKELAETVAILNMVENQTGISLAGLVDGFSRAAGVARSAGVSVRDLAAMMAALVPATGSAAQAGNALKTIFSRLLSPTKEATEVLGLMGINIADLQWKSSSVTDRLKIMAKAFDGLSDSQKGVVSSVVASRWQINKFEVLMRELNSTTGFYQRALDSTKDPQKVFTQAQNELNAVLASSPRRLQQIGVLLQNALADTIQPLIPLILALAGGVSALATSFSNLNPGLQKLIVAFLLLLAVIGPVLRYVGATMTLVGSLGRVFALAAGPIVTLTTLLWSLVSVPVLAFFGAIGRAALLGGRAALAMIPSFAYLITAIQTILLVGARGAGVVWRSGMLGLAVLTRNGLTAIATIWRVTLTALGAIGGAFWATMRIIFLGGWASLQVTMIAGAAALGRIWRGFTVGLAVATSLSLARIRAMFAALPAFIRTVSTAIQVALTGPWGAALVGVIVLVVAFWKDLKKLWTALVTGTIKAFNALPQGIRNAMLAVVNIVRSAVMAVYKLFSWMNPWAHHSPSLVENVTTGMDEITKQFARAEGAASVFAKAGLDLEEFGKHVRRLQAVADAKQFADLRKILLSIAPDAIPSFDALTAVLGPLRDELELINVDLRAQQAIVDGLKPALDAANQAYDAQKAILENLEKVAGGYKDQLDAATQKMEDFAKAPIEGMKSMGDAIFNNTMQQKQLQLQLMQMEDAVGPLDKLQGRLNAINGQMEMLQGEQTDLRNAGAGSEILSQYDDQIAALEQQQQVINDQVKPLQDLSDAIADLGRKGQELDLQNSLQFDPLKKQIDDVANAMNELPFDQIIAGVTAQRAEVDRLTKAYNDAQAAVDQQTAIVDQLDAARGALQRNYDIENDKLSKLKDQYQAVEDRIRSITQAFNDLGQAASAASGDYMSPGAENFLASAGGNFPDPGGLGGVGREQLNIEDQSKMIDDFTKEIADKTKNMFGLFDFLDPIKRGWNSAMDWLKANIVPSLQIFFGTVGAAVASMNPFKGTSSWLDFINDIVKSIGDAFSFIWKAIGPEVMDFVQNIWKALQDAFKEIQPEIAKFRDLIGPTGEALKNIWDAIKPVLAVVGALLLVIIKILIRVLAEGIGPLIRGIADVVSGLIRILRGIIEFIVGVFTGDWEMAWKGIQDIFLGLWDTIWGAIKGIALTIWGIIKGLFEGIVDSAKWLYNEMVGHSIIPDLINGIGNWFMKLVGFIRIPFDMIRALIYTAVDLIKAKLNEWLDRFSWVRDAITGIINFLKDKFWEIVNRWIDVVNSVRNWIDTLVDKFNALKNRFSFSGLFDGLKSAFKSAMDWIIGKWNNLSFGVGDFKIGTPHIPFLARGGVTNGVAVVGEGRGQYPEYVIPTDPNYRKRAVQLFAALGKEIGVGRSPQGALLASIVAGQSRGVFGQKVQMLASGGIVGGNFRLRGAMGMGAVVIAPHTTYKEVHFHGDLSFPNVRSGDDAKTFIDNLEALLDGE